MLGSRRSNYDFVVEILQICVDPIEITKLYHKVKTQHSILMRWLNIGLNCGLVENFIVKRQEGCRRSEQSKYQTTQKGRDFLELWIKVQTFIEES